MRRPAAVGVTAALLLLAEPSPAGAATRPLPLVALKAWGGPIRRLTAAERQRMTGVSWRPGCPVGLGDLRLVRVVHRGFDGADHRGAIVVHRRAATGVHRAFAAMHAAGFPLRRVAMVDDYGGSDDAAMAADATTGFNCRTVAGTTRWSVHAYGLAIDVNPVENPYVSGSTVSPPAGRPYADRSVPRPGMLYADGPAVRAFAAMGWGWGGTWTSAKDYQHVSEGGR